MSSEGRVGPPSGDDELRQLSEVLNRTYLRSEEEGAAWLKNVRAEDLRVVRAGDRVAGCLLLLPDGQWFGGRPVSMTGIANVAIDPEHRASGLGGVLMRQILEEIHAAGMSLSALYPSTLVVYRRTGYELAGSWVRYRMPCSSIEVRDRELDVRRIDPETAGEVLPPLYAERARRTAGHLHRSAFWWQRLLSSEREEVHIYTVGPASEPQGYTVFSQAREDGWKYDLRCRDLVALTPGAARRLYTFFADHRSFARDLTWNGGPGDPIATVFREPVWEPARSWPWMLRMVDVRGALADRGYAPDVEAEVHLEVRDDVLPWNHGRFVLEVSGGQAKVRKGGRGRVRIDVRGLAPLYTGYLGPRELLATGYLEATERDLDRAGAVFAGPAPWLADFF